jgi:hypothetical protein
MDFSIEVMLPERGAPDFTGTGNNGYPMLSVVAVYDHRKNPSAVGMQRTGYIHVTNAPDGKFDKIKNQLETIWVGSAKRAWSCVSSRLSAFDASALLASRQTEMPWGQFQALIRNNQENRDADAADFNAVAKEVA